MYPKRFQKGKKPRYTAADDDASKLSGLTSTEENVSTYLPSSPPEDEELTDVVSSKSKKQIVSRKHSSKKSTPVWATVQDKVILCGQKTLHFQNAGNILFKNYIHAGVVPGFEGNLR